MSSGYDLIIIGGGPAGLTAAIYAGRFGLKTLLIEKAILGGLASTTFHIDNYPGFPEGISGMDLANKLEEQARKYHVEITYGPVTAIENDHKHKLVQVENKKFKSKAIILATGTEPKKLNIPGEAELRGRGVSYCATCDGPFYRDKDIVVAGGGNSAVEEAIFLTRYAKKISIVHRRDQLRADQVLAKQALEHPKIFILWNSMVEEVKGTNRVEEIVLKSTVTEKKSIVKANGLFIYVGSIPQTGFLKGVVSLDEHGFITTTGRLTTSVSGIFVAGDVRNKSLRQVVTATADGAIAADEARKYIEAN
ncbi:thioredoxin-disulfide reductase [candidate division WOR-1 bacterium RIFOXYA12_FULL_43_27]|uniref:Thioredoxin reductase n=1 Tax=candidate division WOR-1 bacterium RIFOXYC2_FULL_46_14 TaxID=1802587 RepID=A0A1F4U6I5_UNCSA|nr:MAG: thioredoxin-disulfide reductase [candidate division WOR-1 bacterium RIFOXYA12_FULL_43_27]OGC20932.1 MAG: thioredoxin-disulfide reductase [candidate division WOR-1 bacterium RIFOXYB2_FULL_46_45]OGC32308.1 MAG: thioredoxin-disulfide reductase [candidate division WOR-1 bacterium RIFOXYA2_FULL_46_56]OGC40489.1 MAG: thioredoxin-disulfide reductase [candidate division WOR-1 bacterium RIFOXYC2_FULL_46_14]